MHLEGDFQKKINGWNTLIVETQSTSQITLLANLINLGFNRSQISIASSFHEAVAEISNSKPQIILSNLSLSGESGLDLVSHHRGVIDSQLDRFFGIFTENTSQAAVASAIEEEIDAYILKPYRPESMKKELVSAFEQKAFPTPYLVRIEEGRVALKQNQFQDAFIIFESAVQLNPRPVLANYYLGRSHHLTQELDLAEAAYRKGLAINPQHFKSLLSLAELLMSQKRKGEAYSIVKQLTYAFPVNAERLKNAFRMAIETRNFVDIDDYYEIFIRSEARSDSLVVAVCAALGIVGKFFLQKNSSQDAYEYFQKAAKWAAGRPALLKNLIGILVEFKATEEAHELLGMFAKESRKDSNYLCAEFLVDSLKFESEMLIHKGRQLIKQGIEEVSVYKILITHLKKMGYENPAQEFAQKAKQIWPQEAF